MLLTKADEAAFDVLEGKIDGFFKGEGGLFLTGILDGDVAFDFASSEDGPAQAGPEGPQTSFAFEEFFGLDGGNARAGSQGKFWIEIGYGDANTGGGGGELAFRAADVGTAADEVAGQANGDARRPNGLGFGADKFIGNTAGSPA